MAPVFFVANCCKCSHRNEIHILIRIINSIGDKYRYVKKIGEYNKNNLDELLQSVQRIITAAVKIRGLPF